MLSDAKVKLNGYKVIATDYPKLTLLIHFEEKI